MSNHFILTVGNQSAGVLALLQSMIARDANSWWHYMGNVWIICACEDIATWNAKISNFLRHYPNAQFFLLELEPHKSRNGLLPKEAWDWLKEHHL